MLPFTAPRITLCHTHQTYPYDRPVTSRVFPFIPNSLAANQCHVSPFEFCPHAESKCCPLVISSSVSYFPMCSPTLPYKTRNLGVLGYSYAILVNVTTIVSATSFYYAVLLCKDNLKLQTTKIDNELCDSKGVKRFERSNGLDTALYKNYLYIRENK